MWSTSSVIIQDIKSISDAGSAFLAYFYFDFKDTTKQDSRALLSSILVLRSSELTSVELAIKAIGKQVTSEIEGTLYYTVTHL